MIRTSQLAGILAEVDNARRLRDQLVRVRQTDPAATLSFGGDSTPEAAELAARGDGAATAPLGIALPASMVADGLLQQLRLTAARLALHGLHFDEAERESDIPPPPKRIRRKKDAAA